MNKRFVKFLNKHGIAPCENCYCYSCTQNYDGDYSEDCALSLDVDEYHYKCFLPNFVKKIMANIRIRKENRYYEQLLKEYEKEYESGENK